MCYAKSEATATELPSGSSGNRRVHGAKVRWPLSIISGAVSARFAGCAAPSSSRRRRSRSRSARQRRQSLRRQGVATTSRRTVQGLPTTAQMISKTMRGELAGELHGVSRPSLLPCVVAQVCG